MRQIAKRIDADRLDGHTVGFWTKPEAITPGVSDTMTLSTREGGEPQWTSGPKRAYVDRVEWTIIPDQATAASAMQTGEMDWWEQPPADLVPTLGGLTTTIKDPTGLIGTLRMNQLLPPFDNPAIRQVLLKVVDQTDFMQAVTGTDPKLMHAPVGFFCPKLPMANDAGIGALTSKRDLQR